MQLPSCFLHHMRMAVLFLLVAVAAPPCVIASVAQSWGRGNSLHLRARVPTPHLQDLYGGAVVNTAGPQLLLTRGGGGGVGGAADAAAVVATAALLPRTSVAEFSFAMPPARQHGEETPPICGVASPVHSWSDMDLACPKRCPLWTEKAGEPGSFMCVGNSSSYCRAANPSNMVADAARGICRPCLVPGCVTCTSGTSKDLCAECGDGYTLVDGWCWSHFLVASRCFLILFAVLALVVGLWLLDLACRPVTNEEGLRLALKLRARAKLRQPRNVGEASEGTGSASSTSTRQRWPLTTNLLTTEVAGKGVLLHFNFQFAIIAWTFAVSLAWAVFAMVVDRDLFVLGTRDADTPRQYSIVVHWGRETQERLSLAKARFFFGVYVVSFMLALAHSVRQLRMFQKRNGIATHKSFCAKCVGLPRISGQERVEEDLQRAIVKATGEPVVGVSVCWDMGKHASALTRDVSEELCLMENFRRGASSSDEQHKVGRHRRAVRARMQRPSFVEAPLKNAANVPRKALDACERAFLSPEMQRLIKKGRVTHSEHLIDASNRHYMPLRDIFVDGPVHAGTQEHFDAEDVITTLQTGELAFVVFATQAARDAAVRLLKKVGGMQFHDTVVHLKAADCEPQSVLWRNAAPTSTTLKLFKICLGMLSISLAVAFWVLVFYLPWASFVTSFDYRYGQGPSVWAETSFTILIVVGNATIYTVCSEVADYIGFLYVDTREVCYTLLYSFACLSQVVLDLCIMFFVAYKAMMSMGLHTHDERLLFELGSFTERFESYAMQRQLANNLWWYSFPSTFLAPFLAEPFVTVMLPKFIMTLIIRTHSEFKGPRGEGYLASTEMDLSRYADILLNVMLAVLMLFFPSAYVLWTFLPLAFSHVVIYAIDHWRVLRSIPACEFASMRADWFAQWMLSVPCGLLLSCAVWKTKCQGVIDISCPQLIAISGAALALHVLLHTLLLVFVVPLFGRRDEPRSNIPYKECAQRIACSFFSANPVHCLRSRHLYEHEPPFDFFMEGREHLLRVNPEIGAYFSDNAVQPAHLGYVPGKDQTPNQTPEHSPR